MQKGSSAASLHHHLQDGLCRCTAAAHVHVGEIVHMLTPPSTALDALSNRLGSRAARAAFKAHGPSVVAAANSSEGAHRNLCMAQGLIPLLMSRITAYFPVDTIYTPVVHETQHPGGRWPSMEGASCSPQRTCQPVMNGYVALLGVSCACCPAAHSIHSSLRAAGPSFVFACTTA